MTNDEDFAAMLAEYEAPGRAKRPKPGDLVSGKVIAIGKDAVFVDLGGKAEGVLSRDQITDDDGRSLKVKVGDTVEARVIGDGGGTIELRVKIGAGPTARAELVTAMESQIPVEGQVTEVIKGGLVVNVAGVRGFCPASQIDNRFVEDLAPYVGQKLQFRITRYETGQRGNLVLSRRALLEEEQARRAAAIKDKLVVGAVLRGKVVSIRPFGAFVDLGGVEGLLHVSELGFSRIENPEEVVQVGQELDVQIVKIEAGEPGKPSRIGLSLKSLGTDPWRDGTSNLAVGAKVTGKVTRLQQFGAFVEISLGVEGLLHISELGGGKRIHHPRDVLSVGQTVEASIVSIDPERRRIGLSLRDSDEASGEDLAHAQASTGASRSLGTFGDLLQKKRPR